MSPRRQGRRRALGQHYLIDSAVTALMVRLAAIGRDDRVLEIGTGRGALTRVLSGLSDRFEAFELDRDNYLATRELGLDVVLHLGDAFAGSRGFDVLVSSLPYSESSNFVEWLSRHNYERAVVLLQRDFVDKLLARPGQDGYRAISVISQLSSEVRPELDVAREAFDPPPRVSSAVVVVRPRDVLSLDEIRLVKMLFSQRRRKLSGALKQLGLETGETDPGQLSRRVQDLAPSDFRGVLDKIR
ncbi:MAG: rRNA adenine N(6)-methyltransferase family protein [Thaumarchaeota archaeon]|nr:rRNA adenine N(6)-methyltransferase family protein [Nitrososphaerota archaeon]